MSYKEITYRCLPNFVLRTPLLPFTFYEEISQNTISDEDIFSWFESPYIKEALFLASPELHGQLDKWIHQKVKDPKKITNLRFAIFKYISRMSSRCTPFGLFAGCAVGRIEEFTQIEIGTIENFKRHTRLDMNFLVSFSQALAEDENIKSNLLFFPNTSLYNSGNQLRYVEYYYVNGSRKHSIASVENSDYLKTILEYASRGSKIDKLAASITGEEVTKKDAKEFIELLIENQILISELEPSVSGPEFLTQIISTLNKIEKAKPLINILEEINQGLFLIDKKLGNSIQSYNSVKEKIEKLNTTYIDKFLFQTDMSIACNANFLSKTIVNDVKKALIFLNKINRIQENSNLTKFKEAFQNRYGEREIELSKALDVETGIGYAQDSNSEDFNPLIDDLILPTLESPNVSSTNEIQTLINKKFLEAYKRNDYDLSFSDKDVNHFKDTWDDLPNTFSIIVELVKIHGEQRIKIGLSGGSSGANILARFCHSNKEIEKHTRNIVELESKMAGDKILAEIVHLPEARVGNILMRPHLRAFEIPYLAKSKKDSDHQVSMNDLLVSVRDNKIKLRSRKLNKEVLPFLSNSHNFSSNSLPAYHFLCDIQTQGLRPALYFPSSPFLKSLKFLPRVSYKNIIMCEARWSFVRKDFLELVNTREKDSKKAIDGFRKKHSIPKYAMLKEWDNELLINFENLLSVQMFLNAIKNRNHFFLTEFLHEESYGLTNKKNQHYTNQVILSFYKEGGA